MDKLLILFIKYPEPGKVKTRLGREIGHEKACLLYEEMVKKQIADLNCPGYDLALYVDDHRDITAYRKKFGENLNCFYQKGQDLGKRMEHAFSSSFHKGFARIILMGSDIPLLDAQAVNGFFDHLHNGDMVIGPTVDGGYYMIGFNNKVHVPVFQNIPWSSGTVFKTTLARATGLNLIIEKLWFDVDTAQDLNVYTHLLQSGKKFSDIDIEICFPSR